LTIKPIFDETRCDGCGLCVTVCRCGALEMQNDKVRIIEVAHCGWCMDCELVCTTGALQCPFEIVTLDT